MLLIYDLSLKMIQKLINEKRLTRYANAEGTNDNNKTYIH